MDAFLKVVQTINSYLSDYVLVILLIGTGVFFTIKTRFVQVRCLGEGMKKMFGELSLKGKQKGGGLSSFQALTTAVAAQVGTGNIIGACGAILLGGPGAIFWMWVIAFFGMATIYAEAVLAQKTRVVAADGSVKGGPVYYIRQAFKGNFGKFLAGFFAVAIILALGFMGCMVQSNSIASTCTNALGIPSWVVGLVIAILCGAVFFGGVKRIAAVTEKIVPIMALLYILGSLIVIFANIKVLPQSIAMIFKYAFAPQAIIGGSVGAALKTALSQGAKRGLFSNEAGMGSTPHAHALAQVKKPHEQGVVAMAGMFIDTFVVITLTALVVITSLYAGDGILASGSAEGVDKTNMAQLAFGGLVGDKAGAIFVAVCLFFFAFSTILSWNLFGKLNVEYLFGKKATVVYTLLAVCFIFLGSVLSNDLVWELTDMFNYLMVLPNAIALIALSKTVRNCALDKDTLPLAAQNNALDMQSTHVSAVADTQSCEILQDTEKAACDVDSDKENTSEEE
ncbi:MAG: alanine/glycine:cation symporter family protein [Christensenellales bacterium]